MCVAVIRSKQLIWMYDLIAMIFFSNGVNYTVRLYFIIKEYYFYVFLYF